MKTPQIASSVKYAPPALFALALLPRLAAALFWHTDGLYGQDAYAYFEQAAALARRLPAGLPPPQFHWPNGFPLLAALLMPLTGVSPLAGQLVALLSGALLSPLLYLLCRDLFPGEPRGHIAGLIAGLSVAVAGQPLLSSIVVMADMPALMWLTLAAWLTVRSARPRPQPALTFLAAGAAAGLAVITRWVYLLALPALVAFSLLAVGRRRLRWWQPPLAALSGALVGLPQLWLSLQRPDTLLGHMWLMSWQPAHFWQRQFENPDGQFSYALPNALFYAQPGGHPAFLFPLLGLMALWGSWQLWRSRRFDALLLLLGWVGPVYLFLAGIPYQNLRFGLSLLPPLAALAGIGLADVWPQSRRRPLVPALAALSLAAMLLWAIPMLNGFFSTQQRSKDIARQTLAAVPPDAALLAFDITLTLRHATHLPVLELYYQTPDTLADLTGAQSPLYLLVNEANINHQWQGKAPQQNLRWLQNNAALTFIEQFPPFTLYKIEPLPCKETTVLADFCATHPAAAICGGSRP
ncbi:MAG: hypothetical protein Kow0031_34740 [Anaerolineae bacterium]